jgi:hypothetical protein
MRAIPWMDRNTQWVFVPVQKGLYMRVEVAVIRAPCAECGAEIGVPCTRLGRQGKQFSVLVHSVRKTHAKAGHLNNIYHDIIEDGEAS